jgi:Skp family chaperone for outer membrane proteins
MKFFRLSIIALLAASVAGSLTAQPVKTPVIKVLEPARIGYINSSAFAEPATGIKQLVKVIQNLQTEFTATESELSLLNEKLRTIVGELNKLRADPVANAKAIEEKQAAGLALQQELQTKQQAAQQAFNQRQQEIQAPVIADIGKELRAYSKERDLSLLIDLSKLNEAVIDAKPELDLTADFVAIYNAEHP